MVRGAERIGMGLEGHAGACPALRLAVWPLTSPFPSLSLPFLILIITTAIKTTPISSNTDDGGDDGGVVIVAPNLRYRISLCVCSIISFFKYPMK